MIVWRRGTVTATRRAWPGALELTVAVEGPSPSGDLPALAHTAVVGTPQVGDTVLLNASALALGLGTGGHALVVAVPDRLPPDPQGPGHLVKARYTPLQAVVQGVDEQGSPHHALLAGDPGLSGMPVIVADLHSSLPAVVAGLLHDRPATRVAYVMTDGGALPIAHSRTVAALADRLCGTVTTGQAYGGDAEAVSLHSGLLASRHALGADVAIVTQGPGNLGTGTTWGFSGVAVGEAVNAASVLGGRPVGVLRLSGADPRERHRGLSHHSLTAYGRVALSPADLVVPRSAATWVEPAAFPRHRLVEVEDSDLVDVLRSSGLPLSTMGRALDDDPVAFVAAAAAGRHVAGLIG